MSIAAAANGPPPRACDRACYVAASDRSTPAFLAFSWTAASICRVFARSCAPTSCSSSFPSTAAASRHLGGCSVVSASARLFAALTCVGFARSAAAYASRLSSVRFALP